MQSLKDLSGICINPEGKSFRSGSIDVFQLDSRLPTFRAICSDTFVDFSIIDGKVMGIGQGFQWEGIVARPDPLDKGNEASVLALHQLFTRRVSLDRMDLEQRAKDIHFVREVAGQLHNLEFEKDRDFTERYNSPKDVYYKFNISRHDSRGTFFANIADWARAEYKKRTTYTEADLTSTCGYIILDNQGQRIDLLDKDFKYGIRLYEDLIGDKSNWKGEIYKLYWPSFIPLDVPQSKVHIPPDPKLNCASYPINRNLAYEFGQIIAARFLRQTSGILGKLPKSGIMGAVRIIFDSLV